MARWRSGLAAWQAHEKDEMFAQMYCENVIYTPHDEYTEGGCARLVEVRLCSPNTTLFLVIRPPGTVVPDGLMFYC